MYYINYSTETTNYSDSVLDDGSLQVKVDLPGVGKEDIQLSYAGRQVDFTYSREGGETKTKSLTVHSKYDTSKAKASLRNGVLTITIPKREEVKNKIKVE